MVFTVIWSSALANEVLASFSLAREHACAIACLYIEDMCIAVYIHTHACTCACRLCALSLQHYEASWHARTPASSPGRLSPAIAGTTQHLSHKQPGQRDILAHRTALPVTQQGTGTRFKPGSASQPWGLAYAVDNTQVLLA